MEKQETNAINQSSTEEAAAIFKKLPPSDRRFIIDLLKALSSKQE